MSRKILVPVLLCAIAAAATPAAAYERPRVNEVVSVGIGGQETTEPPGLTSPSYWLDGASASRNGRFVAFASTADNLVPGDRNGISDIFVRDRRRGKTEIVSLGVGGIPAVGVYCLQPGLSSFDPAISANGRYVAFRSYATNLVPGDVNGSSDVFRFDRKTGRTELVTESHLGGPTPQIPCPGPPDAYVTGNVAISGNGRHVAFASSALLLTKDQASQDVLRDAFIRDMKAGKNELVSVPLDPAGLPRGLGGESEFVSVSGDGRYVAFTSESANLVEGDTNRTSLFTGADVFVRDRVKKTTERVSVASDGSQGYAPQPYSSSQTSMRFGVGLSRNGISGDGRYVVFVADYSNLVPADTNSNSPTQPTPDVFVHDRETKRTERVNVTSEGIEASPSLINSSYDTLSANISADGRYVTFDSRATNLSGSRGDMNAFVYDRARGALTLVTLDHQGEASDEDCHTAGLPYPLRPHFGIGGREVVYTACSTDLTTDRFENAYFRTFLTDLGPPVGVGGLRAADRAGDARVPAADILKASLIPRAETNDLFGVIEVGSLSLASGAPELPGASSALLYGLRFKVGDKTYEVRASGETLGISLFDCSTSDLSHCTKVRGLLGGFGTTGERIVFSVPTAELGLQQDAQPSEVEAFTALGSQAAGRLTDLDSVTLTSKN